MPAAHAAVNITVIDVTAPGTIGVEARKAVFGINMTGSGTFQGLQVQFADQGGDGDFDLAGLSDLETSPVGVAVYRDTGTSDDALDDGDPRVSSSFENTSGTVDIVVSSGIPPSAEGSYTYFLAVQTSDTIDDGDDFTVTIPEPTLLNCAFVYEPSNLLDACDGGTSGVITVNIAPTAELISTPTSPDGNIVWQFSENVVGVDAQNVVVREGLLGGTNLPATVEYDSEERTATINPTDPLAAGQTYRTIVNPGNVATEDRIKDAQGNEVGSIEETFALPQFGFTPGVVRGSTWYLSDDFDGDHDVTAFAYGGSKDVRLVGDWNGDGEFTVGVRRGNLWYLSNNHDGVQDVPTFAFGNSTDAPVVGDWNGDGTWTPGVIRGNTWYLSNDFDGDHDIAPFRYGNSTDRFVVGDWDDDDNGSRGRMTPGVVRGNRWYLSDGFNGVQTVPAFTYGASSDRKLVGDWDGDGKSTPAVIRGNVWYLNNDFDGTHNIAPFALGASSDFAVAGDWDKSIQP
ncbi:MAG: Ig-like domain-containing protein [Actinomycetota bacterium]